MTDKNGDGDYSLSKMRFAEEVKAHLDNNEYYPEKSLGWYLGLAYKSLQRDAAVLQNMSDESICSEYKSHKKDYPSLYNEICDFLEPLINSLWQIKLR